MTQSTRNPFFFFAENNVGNVDDVKVKGCFNLMQTKKDGVIKCDSISNAAIKFGKLPEFTQNCKPEEVGTEGSKIKNYIMNHQMFM